MSAALPLALSAAIDELARQWPARWPGLPPWPETSRERVLRHIGTASERLLRVRLAIQRVPELSDADLSVLTACIAHEMPLLEGNLRLLVGCERWGWLREILDDALCPWLRDALRTMLAGVLTALEHSHDGPAPR